MPTITSTFDKRDVIIIAIGATRSDGEHITDAQKETAMNAAKSVLQVVGADVAANSTAILNQEDLEDGETITATINVAVVKNSVAKGTES